MTPLTTYFSLSTSPEAERYEDCECPHGQLGSLKAPDGRPIFDLVPLLSSGRIAGKLFKAGEEMVKKLNAPVEEDDVVLFIPGFQARPVGSGVAKLVAGITLEVWQDRYGQSGSLSF